jgi:ribosomal protein S18 acetylase RimI-like enzyme
MIMSLNELSAVAVVEMVKANWAEFYMHLGRAAISELSIGPHLSWLLTGVPDAFLNVVFRTDMPSSEADEIVDEALHHFRTRHIARLSWWVETPATDVGRTLKSRGLTFNEGGTAMAADLRSVPDGAPTLAGLEIVRVVDRTALRPWIEVMRVGFGLPADAEKRLFELFLGVALDPPMHTYLAIHEGRPVATSQLFVGAGVGGIYNVTCLPEARGRGIGTAITRAPLVDAQRQGYDLIILQASRLGYPIYRRLGFMDYGRLNTYQFSSDDSESSS